MLAAALVGALVTLSVALVGFSSPSAAAGGWTCSGLALADTCEISGSGTGFTLHWSTRFTARQCPLDSTSGNCLKVVTLRLGDADAPQFVTGASCNDAIEAKDDTGYWSLEWVYPVPSTIDCVISGDLSSLPAGGQGGFSLAEKGSADAADGSGSYVIEQHELNAYRDSSAVPPTVDFTATALATPLKFQFVADASTQAGATIASYDWDFGDGTRDTTTGASPAHTFTAPGTYHVTVTVKDSNGQQTTVGRDVVVSAKLVVNSIADTANGPSAGQACDTGATVGTPAVPECTLRAALQAANAGTTAQSITFAIPGVTGIPTISVGSNLPATTVPVSIDGTSQPGGWVDLSAGASINGLRLAGGQSLVKGLVFDGFADAVLAGANTPGNQDGDKITGNRFGVNAAGTSVTVQPATAILMANVAGITISDNVISASGFGVQAIRQSSGTISGNRINVRADDSATLTPLPSVSIALRDVGAFTVQNNTMAAESMGIWLHGTSTAGTSITGNHIGTNSAGTARLATFGLGVNVDGVPGVTVADNVIATSHGPDSYTADVVVTGIAQCGADTCAPPTAALDGAITGGTVTVRGNSLGVLATGSTAGAAGNHGVLVFGKAPKVTIDSNVIAGHFQLGAQVGEVQLIGTTNAIVGSNTIGTNAAGTAAIRADVGVDVVGAAGTTVQNNVIGAASTAGVLVRALTFGPSLSQSSKTTIRDNKIGVNRAGTAAIANQVGVIVTDASSDTAVGPTNVICGNTTAGVQISGTASGTVVIDDAIGTDPAGHVAIANGVGVDVGDLTAGTDIVSSLIAGNTGAGIHTASTNVVTIAGNEIGRHSKGIVIPNGVGVDARGPATLATDTVQGNLGAGVISAPSMPVAVLGSTTFSDNGDVGIVSPGAPTAPTIDAVLTTSASGKKHVTFVVTNPGSPGTLAGVAIYANADCTQPGSAQTTVATTSEFFQDASTFVAKPTSNAIAGGYTATAILITQTGKADITKPVGRTSAISACVTPHEYPDTSGTGVPDIIQKALGGDPTKPNTVRFLGADGYPVALVASRGRLTNVTPTATGETPALPAGVSLPSGPFSFTVTGVPIGAAVSVGVVSHATTLGQANAYWRYGAPTSAAPPQWYRWDYDPTTGVGAQVTDRSLILNFIDGDNGDDDATANGTIVDPGAPAIDTTTALPATPPPPRTTTTLANTGEPHSQALLVSGLLALAVGTGLVLAGRSRRKPVTR